MATITFAVGLPLGPEDLRFLSDEGWSLSKGWDPEAGHQEDKTYLFFSHDSYTLQREAALKERFGDKVAPV